MKSLGFETLNSGISSLVFEIYDNARARARVTSVISSNADVSKKSSTNPSLLIALGLTLVCSILIVEKTRKPKLGPLVFTLQSSLSLLSRSPLSAKADKRPWRVLDQRDYYVSITLYY